MSDVGHTPGPWVVEGEDIFAKVMSPAGWIIAETDHVHVGKPGEWEAVHLANMRLIAVAPELLELARIAADVVDDDLENRPARHSLGNLHARLRAAIRKATEGQ